MRQPPGQILFARPAYEWINRVAQRLTEFSSLALSDKEKAALRRAYEIDFVYSTATIAGHRTGVTEVTRIIDLPTPGPDLVADAERPTAELIASLRIVETVAESEALTPDLLLKLNNPFGAEGRGFRKSALAPSGPMRPTDPDHIPAAVESISRWLTAESFSELNPLEQASITHLRLLEVHPFEQANLETAFVAASLFTLRAQMPPIIISQRDAGAYLAAVEEGTRMNTRPMVELMAASVERTLSEMIHAVKRA